MTDTRIHQLVEYQADKNADGLAIIDADGETQYSYASYWDCIQKAAKLLTANGVEPTDRVLIVAENAMTTAVFIYASSLVGAWAIPVNARMAAVELAKIQAHADPKVIVYTTGISKEAKQHADEASAQAENLGFGDIAIKALPNTEANPEPEADSVAVMLYTTGTTGAPKGVMLTHANLCFGGKASATLREMTAADVIYGALPMTHVFGLASMLIAAAHAGAAIQLEARFDPAKLYTALQGKVTLLPAVPQMHALLMSYTQSQGYDRLQNSPLRYVSSGAAPLDPAWKRKAEQFYGIALQNGYGMTETTAGVCATTHVMGNPDISVGPPLPGVEVKIDRLASDEQSDADEISEVGEILTKGPHIMAGYYRNPEATQAAITEDGFMRTGDLGCIDAQGFLHVVGRAKELIIRSGFNVYPPEVESAINDHRDVVQCAVIGRPIEGNEEVWAFAEVRTDSAADEAALKAFIKDKLSSYKRPTRIVIIDKLPTAATGKILKHKLRPLCEQYL